MTFEQVDGIPKSEKHAIVSCEKKKLSAYLDGFMKMGVKYARVKINEYDYSNINTAYLCIKNGVKRQQYPIKVCRRNNQLYLERTDIFEKPKTNRGRKKASE
jgi:hypothetical protein